MPDHYDHLDRYDSIDDPELRSAYLDAIGKTRAYIQNARRMRDAENGSLGTPEKPRGGSLNGHIPRRRPRAPRGPASHVTRPRRNAPRRRARRASIRISLRLIIIVKP
ncbi:hypothetical protein ACFWNG_15985 [Streptomyces sp. NPDC058391]|uniref:hypothetical protein n=1 Tax=Streptomyces sp. NPDC058391 TaxID=3346476 RepID=UPI00364D6710